MKSVDVDHERGNIGMVRRSQVVGGVFVVRAG